MKIIIVDKVILGIDLCKTDYAIGPIIALSPNMLIFDIWVLFIKFSFAVKRKNCRKDIWNLIVNTIKEKK